MAIGNSMLDEEIRRLRIRMDELEKRVIPDFENRSQMLFAKIMPMRKGSEDRGKLEHDYALLSKELRLRSDELMNTKQQVEHLEFQKSLRR